MKVKIIPYLGYSGVLNNVRNWKEILIKIYVDQNWNYGLIILKYSLKLKNNKDLQFF